jgi:uncharacterized protein (DUF305 family)
LVVDRFSREGPFVRRAVSSLSATLLLLVPLTSCSSGAAGSGADGESGTSTGESGTTQGTLLQPGEPGEPNATRDPDDVEPENQFSHSDVAFVQMMIPHHAQAIVMSDLAEKHASDRRVKVMADRIRSSQGPEILAMAAWLEERNLDVPSAAEDPSEWDHSEHGHNAMHGMLTHDQLDRLKAARGRQFDRLFLRGMIQHHQGAIDMADDAAPESTDVRAGEIMGEVAAVQAGEIARMRDLLADLA